MKIFSSFDTKLAKKRYNAAVKQYGRENVLLIRRSPIYLWLRVYNILIAWAVFSLFVLGGAYRSGIGGIITTGWVLVIVLGLYVLWRVGGKLIDYHMDFTLVTPKQITAYDQGGLLDRKVRSLDIMKVKSINIQKSGLTRSIFNFGSIIFFSEGDVSGGENPLGDIELHHISRPGKLKDKINAIIERYQKKEGYINTEGLSSMKKRVEEIPCSTSYEK